MTFEGEISVRRHLVRRANDADDHPNVADDVDGVDRCIAVNVLCRGDVCDDGVSEMSETKRRPIWLRRDGDYIVVLVEENGEWREVIREFCGLIDNTFSHIWEDQPS